MKKFTIEELQEIVKECSYLAYHTQCPFKGKCFVFDSDPTVKACRWFTEAILPHYLYKDEDGAISRRKKQNNKENDNDRNSTEDGSKKRRRRRNYNEND